MPNNKKIKKQQADKTKISLQSVSHPNIDYPVFCFKHLNFKPQTDYKFYKDFIARLIKICSLSWDTINKTDRHSFGTEKMPIGKIKLQMPNFVTPDVSELTVFRANGDNRPFLGLRSSNVFHILFIEEKFGDVYDHD